MLSVILKDQSALRRFPPLAFFCFHSHPAFCCGREAGAGGGQGRAAFLLSSPGASPSTTAQREEVISSLLASSPSDQRAKIPLYLLPGKHYSSLSISPEMSAQGARGRIHPPEQRGFPGVCSKLCCRGERLISYKENSHTSILNAT